MKKYFIIIIIIFVFLIGFGLVMYMDNKKAEEGNELLTVEMYKNVIDNILKDNKMLFENTEYISIDTAKLKDPMNGKVFSKESNKKIVQYLNKYSNIILEKNRDELINEGLGDEEGLKGTLITINVTTVNKSKPSITVNVYKANQGSSSQEYNLKLEKNAWKIESSNFSIQS